MNTGLAKRSFLLLFVLFIPWSAFADRSLKSPSIAQGQVLPKKVLLLPVDIRVSEISAGGAVEKVEEWSKQAGVNVDTALRESGARIAQVQFVNLPMLTTEESEIVDNYLALYDVVGADAFTYGRGQDKAWEHKNKNFDYTLGPGLQFFRERSGADVAMFVVGADHISSGGRKAAMVAGTIFAAAFGVILVPQGGPAFVSTGIVDLETGNILWLNYDTAGGSRDLRVPKDASAMMSEIFDEYPRKSSE